MCAWRAQASDRLHVDSTSTSNPTNMADFNILMQEADRQRESWRHSVESSTGQSSGQVFLVGGDTHLAAADTPAARRPNNRRTGAGAVTAMFDLLDVDHDGEISKMELIDFCAANGQSCK